MFHTLKFRKHEDNLKIPEHSKSVRYVLKRLHNALTSPVQTEVTDSVTEVPICLITLTGPGMEEAGLLP